MKPFEKVQPENKSKEELDILFSEMIKLFNISKTDAENEYKKSLEKKLYDNGTYLVSVNDKLEEVFHLSIKRKDKESIHDWRELQQIKNLIIGEEYVGLEVYPRESEVVDTVNQYHIWVFKDKNIILPFGFNQGLKTEGSAVGQTKQRKF